MGDIWTWILAAASAVVLLSNAVEKIAGAVRAARAPNQAQDQRMDKLESRLDKVEGFLGQDKKRLDSLDEGNRATQRALLALLAHGIDGNNTDQMIKAKDELQEYLITR